MNTTETRPVRILFLMEESPVVKALTQVLGLLPDGSTQCRANNIDDADLIIFDDVRKVEADFRRDKRYGYFDTQRRPIVLRENVTYIGVIDSVITTIKLISEVRASMPAEAPRAHNSTVRPQMAKLPDAHTILVVDDTEAHRDSAYELLGAHRLTVCKGYEEAMEALATSNFEIVLTDLHMPMSSNTMGDKFRLGELVPYGILIALEAARRRSSYVAVVTDINHHNDPFSAAFDHFSRFEFSVESATVVMRHARFTAGGGKNWVFHLNEVMVP
jgi:CheY-like chemotaxis protein